MTPAFRSASRPGSQRGDVLVVRASSRTTESLPARLGGELVEGGRPLEAQELLSGNLGVAEILIPACSEHVGRTLSVGDFSERFRVQVLNVRRRGRLLSDEFQLEEGDSLLVRGPWAALEALSGQPRELVVVGNPEAIRRAQLTPRAGVAAAVLVGMVGLMLSGAVSGSIAALIAALVMVLTGCATRDGAYRAVSWSSVVLIGAMIPMSTALETTGGAQALAEALVSSLGELHPLALLAGIYLVTTALSQVINNTATAVLMAPIVLQAAAGMALSPRPTHGDRGGGRFDGVPHTGGHQHEPARLRARQLPFR